MRLIRAIRQAASLSQVIIATSGILAFQCSGNFSGDTDDDCLAVRPAVLTRQCSSLHDSIRNILAIRDLLGNYAGGGHTAGRQHPGCQG